MIVLKNKDNFEKFTEFDDVFSDGRMNVPGKPMRDFRGALELRKKLNRPLTDKEVKQFE